MRQIILHGQLAEEFGAIHRYDVMDPAEAVRALCANFKEFASYVINEDNSPNGYHVVTDVGDIVEDHLSYPCASTIDIIPVVAGAKSGFFKIILGAALIGAAFLPGLQAPLFASSIGGFSPSIASIAFSIGTSLALGGVAQMLTPTLPTSQVPDAPANLPSFSFDGPVNTVAQGNAVPVGYGRLRVGSAVISTSITADEIVS